MNKSLVFKVVALVELAAMLPWVPSYLEAFTVIQNVGTGFFVAAVVVVLNTLFLTSPLLSIYGAFKDKKWCWWVLCIFPVIAFVYGISAIPYLSHFAPVGLIRTLALVVINGGLIILVVTLSIKARVKTPKNPR